MRVGVAAAHRLQPPLLRKQRVGGRHLQPALAHVRLDPFDLGALQQLVAHRRGFVARQRALELQQLLVAAHRAQARLAPTRAARQPGFAQHTAPARRFAGRQRERQLAHPRIARRGGSASACAGGLFRRTIKPRAGGPARRPACASARQRHRDSSAQRRPGSGHELATERRMAARSRAGCTGRAGTESAGKCMVGGAGAARLSRPRRSPSRPCAARVQQCRNRQAQQATHSADDAPPPPPPPPPPQRRRHRPPAPCARRLDAALHAGLLAGVVGDHQAHRHRAGRGAPAARPRRHRLAPLKAAARTSGLLDQRPVVGRRRCARCRPGCRRRSGARCRRPAAPPARMPMRASGAGGGAARPPPRRACRRRRGRSLQ